jgi:Major Facilitator Superfamily
MTLDSSVMNVSIATVAKDVGTTVTGIQGAITAYTLVMASLMITGAKVGAIIGRKRAFAIGCIIYGCGSLTTALAPSLPVLLVGWSLLEGVGAALILPAIVALVAGNFPTERRPAAYGLVAAAGAIAVAVGPLIGGFVVGLIRERVERLEEILDRGRPRRDRDRSREARLIGVLRHEDVVGRADHVVVHVERDPILLRPAEPVDVGGRADKPVVDSVSAFASKSARLSRSRVFSLLISPRFRTFVSPDIRRAFRWKAASRLPEVHRRAASGRKVLGRNTP